MNAPTITVIGLGYVGLPLGVAVARHFPVVGIDLDAMRIDELRRGHDRTAEIAADVLAGSSLEVSADPRAGAGADLIIVTVPTPVDNDNRPDLGPIDSATRTVATLVDPSAGRYDLVVGAVRHDAYARLEAGALQEMLASGGTLADVKGMWRGHRFDKTTHYWTL